jgi:hypothetical protein
MIQRMSPDIALIGATAFSFIGLIVLITRFKVHAFLALIWPLSCFIPRERCGILARKGIFRVESARYFQIMDCDGDLAFSPRIDLCPHPRLVWHLTDEASASLKQLFFFHFRDCFRTLNGGQRGASRFFNGPKRNRGHGSLNPGILANFRKKRSE